MSTQASSTTPDKPQVVKVWDPLVRIFHIGLITFFVAAWVSAEESQALHEWAGYTVAALIVFRLFWGLFGTPHARFSDFIYSPRQIVSYLVSLPTRRVKHYLGHNPAGGAMVIAMLVTLSLLTLSGMAMVAEEGAGPLAALGFTGLGGEALEEVHEALANLMVLLVGLHIVGVVVSSFLHHENLPAAMLHGRKTVQPQADSGDAS